MPIKSFVFQSNITLKTYRKCCFLSNILTEVWKNGPNSWGKRKIQGHHRLFIILCYYDDSIRKWNSEQHCAPKKMIKRLPHNRKKKKEKEKMMVDFIQQLIREEKKRRTFSGPDNLAEAPMLAAIYLLMFSTAFFVACIYIYGSKFNFSSSFFFFPLWIFKY